MSDTILSIIPRQEYLVAMLNSRTQGCRESEGLHVNQSEIRTVLVDLLGNLNLNKDLPFSVTLYQVSSYQFITFKTKFKILPARSELFPNKYRNNNYLVGPANSPKDELKTCSDHYMNCRPDINCPLFINV